ncbi:uncharacterized protein PV06_11483 [Exophiala oligosperma]|uniref:Uncharacterized protein n=1 Tax=Exophiala oligosperma TaxID=215243 RepID=A0A0D2D1Y3_9EURO|nr:uncharacterized protein PV06_11483 [Exophiala oligosperma]KIW36235.1 hypothetical protein PV06_11483 [Exophiala oligosperma]
MAPPCPPDAFPHKTPSTLSAHTPRERTRDKTRSLGRCGADWSAMATQENVRWLIRLSSLTVTQMKLLRCGKCHPCSIYTCLFDVQSLPRLRAEPLPNSTRCNSGMTYFIVYKQGGSKAPADISSMHEYCRG